MINRILVSLKLGVIFIFMVVAIPHIKIENYAEFMPFGFKGVLMGTAAIYFAYLVYFVFWWCSAYININIRINININHINHL